LKPDWDFRFMPTCNQDVQFWGTLKMAEVQDFAVQVPGEVSQRTTYVSPP
jgi:hypothetical protein